MIVVNLMGGLGNQMFQYALGRKLSLQHNKPLYLDKTFLNRRDLGVEFTYRDYDLDVFNLDTSLIDKFEVTSEFEILSEPIESPLMIDKIETLDYNKNIFITGFFQKECYFKNIENQIIKDFELSIEDRYIKKLELEILSSNSVCVNLRRGDYVSNKNTNYFHGFHGQEFIDKAVPKLCDEVENPIFYIFSDDIDWCIENIKIDFPHFYVDHTYKGYKFSSYLKLMSSCKHFIIPNSTFAWWSAWLSQNHDKKVYVPKNWYRVDKINTEGLIPDKWNKI